MGEGEEWRWEGGEVGWEKKGGMEGSMGKLCSILIESKKGRDGGGKGGCRRESMEKLCSTHATVHLSSQKVRVWLESSTSLEKGNW